MNIYSINWNIKRFKKQQQKIPICHEQESNLVRVGQSMYLQSVT